MEWVVTSGRTVEEAKEAALDELGVDEQDAEFEVLEEPKAGLFGRVRGEARVRARIRPAQPRPKVERRERRRSPKGRGNGKGARGGPSAADAVAPTTADDVPDEVADGAEGADAAPRGEGAPKGRRRGGRGGAKASTPATDQDQDQGTDGGAREGSEMSETTMTVEEQAEAVTEFLEGLLDAFGLDAELVRTPIDDETIEIHVNGDDLGLLIGPKGQTLQAVQELSRTVVQRRAARSEGRIRIDIGGYRERRKEALERFTRQVAEEVRSSGVQKALEPMHPADRKIVHDTANTIDGVRTLSEGEEPRRRVVIAPE